MEKTEIPNAPAATPAPATPFWAHLAPFGATLMVLTLLGDANGWKLAAALAAGLGVAWRLRPWREAAVWAHVAPFAAWLTLLTGLGEPAGWKYAARTAVGLALLLACRPWRWYPSPRVRHLPLALAVGVAIFAVWVGPETEWVKRHAPGLWEFYVRWLVGLYPPGAMPKPLEATPYAPEVCGWPLALVRLAGSAFVVALIEEFFWRSFLYRWLQRKDFLSVDPGTIDRSTFWIAAALFGLEHEQWFAGIVCGAVYAWLYLRTRDLWAACFAHVVTNFLLGLYVLAEGAHAFW